MPSTLALTKKELTKKTDESEQEFEDRATVSAYITLWDLKKRNEEQEREYQQLREHYVAAQTLRGGYIPAVTSDTHMREATLRMHRQLQKDFGSKSLLKNMLIDRLLCAWNTAHSYELLLYSKKYRIENDQIQYNHNDLSMKMLKEFRKGIESCNEQIVRLAQTLQHLSAPPLQVKATNAFFAENQQINQTTAKDLEKIPEATNYAKTCS